MLGLFIAYIEKATVIMSIAMVIIGPFLKEIVVW
jgi:hypothetical protein